jgi:predicted metalloprotease with PDZ domain
MIKKFKNSSNSELEICILTLILSSAISFNCHGQEQSLKQPLQYTVSMPDPSNHIYHVELDCSGWTTDTIDCKLPQWMPGYYQIMEYSKEVTNFSAKRANSKLIPVTKTNGNTWQIIPGKRSPFSISYDVKADRKFVANSYLDSTHGYIIPEAVFMYLNDKINIPVNLKIISFGKWSTIATGLDPVTGKVNEFTAPDFDILYDCPILIGNLEEFPSFKIKGITHRFIAYNPGNFNREAFIANLEKTIKAGVEIIGDIPYNQYTFIGIGPGFGGIEHLNNTTVSFNGNGLDKPDAAGRTLKFLAHEYFHNYNVKRIRPYELGPFDYSKENKTNLLWVSEGLSVYYEYLMVRRAGLLSEEELFKSIENNINTYENDPGRSYQSLLQASYNTWSDGPFGNKPGSTDQSISYYEKGPVIGMILDFTIRNATKNKKSLDDVMRFLYWQYYKKLQRGFTDAEFQQACEDAAGISLSREFEYVSTTKEIDYSTYLSYAGLKISEDRESSTGKKRFAIFRDDKMNSLQQLLFQSWSGE